MRILTAEHGCVAKIKIEPDDDEYIKINDRRYFKHRSFTLRQHGKLHIANDVK